MLLLDPLLLDPARVSSAPLSVKEHFWGRVVDWASDRRVVVGASCHDLICDELANHGYPQNDLSIPNMPLKREYQSAVNSLLSRMVKGEGEETEPMFRPEYLGSALHRFALGADVTATVNTGVFGIATDPSHWDDGECSEVDILPGPPSRLELCHVPGSDSANEREQSVKDFYVEKRVHIIGGQVERRIISLIADRLSADESVIDWIPCEKAKPARDIDKRWQSLRPERDVTVCVTGRIGHAVSTVAATTAEKTGTPHLQVELPSDIVQALVTHALRTLEDEGDS